MLFGRLVYSWSCSLVGVPSDCDLGLGIWYLDHVGECGRKLQAAVSDVQVMGPMTDDHYVKMADGKLLLVKKKSCSVRKLYTQCGDRW